MTVSSGRPHLGGDTMQRTAAMQRRVAPFMLIAVASLLLGLWAGLARIGWDLPRSDVSLMLRHGGLMVVGFVATIIAIERAVAVRTLPAFAAPAFSAAAGLALLLNGPSWMPPAFATASGAAYSVNAGVLLQRHRMPPFVLLLGGALCLGVSGIVWWAGGGYARVVPWWMAFLVLTIVAERLELIRFQRFSRSAVAVGLTALALLVLGPLVALADDGLGARVLGASFILATAWLLPRDIARRTAGTEGLTGFAGVGVLLAYCWLLATGGLLLTGGLAGGGIGYDAVIHAFFIGFVFSTIFAHGPIILPAVTGLAMPYTPLFYLPLVALEGGLVVRIAADAVSAPGPRRWAGMVQAIAIVAFFALAAARTAMGVRASRGSRGPVRAS